MTDGEYASAGVIEGGEELAMARVQDDRQRPLALRRATGLTPRSPRMPATPIDGRGAGMSIDRPRCRGYRCRCNTRQNLAAGVTPVAATPTGRTS